MESLGGFFPKIASDNNLWTLWTGLPFFGYDFPCANAAPVPYPRKGGVPPPCNLAQPPQYPMVGYHVSRHDIAGIWVAFFSRCQRYRCGQDAMTLFRNENVTSSPDHTQPELRFHEKYASAWFEYSNRSTGQRHQVWFNDPQCAHSTAPSMLASGSLSDLGPI